MWWVHPGKFSAAMRNMKYPPSSRGRFFFNVKNFKDNAQANKI